MEVLSPYSAADERDDFVHPALRLRSLGLRARKRLSQSFLANPGVARAIVAAAELDPSHDEVLEVGPGLGVLTEQLVQLARRVVAVELDRDLAAQLPRAIDAGNLTVVNADVLRFDPTTVFVRPYVVVANLPYHVTSPALSHLIGSGPPYSRHLVLMVQREVAERIVAGQGHLSALAVSIQVQAAVRIVLRVSPGSFYPPPRVSSAVLRVDPLPEHARLVARDAMTDFMNLVHAGFAQPRKLLVNSLAHGLAIEKAEAHPLVAKAGIDPSVRPEALSVPDWVRLWHAGLTER
jgi:16S rRNA (adenine1518-N6/adenine1519-N6)-dimethyltransferase